MKTYLIKMKTLITTLILLWFSIASVAQYNETRCLNTKTPDPPKFTKAEVSFSRDFVDFDCGSEHYMIGYILRDDGRKICLKDEQRVVHTIYYDYDDLCMADKRWLPYIMIPGNKVKVSFISCGNGGILNMVIIRNIRIASK